MTAHLPKFQQSPFVVSVTNDRDGNWVVTAGDHSWLHTEIWDAFIDARMTAETYGGAWVSISPTNQYQWEEEYRREIDLL